MNREEFIMDSQDFDWEPPSEAQMKLVQARRERSDRISKLMGDYLLKGYKMLGSTCQTCDTILLQDRQGANYCIACSELDSDADKDDPVTNAAAALAQARELQCLNSPRDAITADSSTVHTVRGINQPVPGIQQGLTSGRIEITSSSFAGRGDFRDTRDSNSLAGNAMPGNVGGLGSVDSQSYIAELVDKLDWAVQELKRSPSVDYSIQLCQLIKSCADAISSVRSAFQA